MRKPIHLQLKLSHKLGAMFMIMAAIALFTGGFGIWSVNQVGGNIQDILHTRADQQKFAYLVKISLKEAEISLTQAITAGPTNGRDFQNARESFDEKTAFIRNYCEVLLDGNVKLGIPAVKKGDPLREVVEELQKGMAAYAVTGNEILAARTARSAGGMTLAQERESKAQAQAALEKAVEKVDDLLMTVNELMAKAGSEAAQITKTANIAMVFACLLAILLASVLGTLSTRNIVRRVRSMAAALAQGAGGDLTIAVRETTGDEIGMLGADFNSMASKLAGMFARVKKTTRELTLISSDLEVASTECARAATHQSLDVAHMSQAINLISASINDVTEDVDGLSLSATGTLTATQQMASSLAEVASKTEQLVRSVDFVSSSMTEMAVSVKQIDSSVASLASASTMTTSSVVALDEAIVQIKQNAVTTAKISGDVLVDAELGHASVEATIAGMQRIKKSSATTAQAMETLKERTSDIGKFLTVINEVAEQTNLLALNAAIIAAQAGVHGQGFAVVATEIKELAERTRNSTKEIAAVVQGLQQEAQRASTSIKDAEECIKEGENLSVNSGHALSKIYEGIKEASEHMTEIALATEEQVRESQQIRSVTERVSDMVTQIVRATREQAKGSELIMAAVQEMKVHNLQVSQATQEQSLTGDMIRGKATDISAMCEHIQKSCHEQKEQFDLIVAAVCGIQESAAVNLNASKVTDESASKLGTQVKLLHQEMGNFRVSAE